MKLLEEMTIWQRVLLTFIIVLVILFVMAIAGFVGGRWEAAQSMVPVDCMDPTERERVRDIFLSGIDQGLRDQVQHLFGIWTKDLNDQPKRAQVGAANAFNAHKRAREFAVKWEPPPC